jgi:hypothetical protein
LTLTENDYLESQSAGAQKTVTKNCLELSQNPLPRPFNGKMSTGLSGGTAPVRRDAE